MTDTDLIREIFKRLDDNFYDFDSETEAQTDSEIAADALNETLYNLGLDSLYTMTPAIIDGLAVTIFRLKEVE